MQSSYAQQSNPPSWGSKKAPPTSWGSQPHPHNEVPLSSNQKPFNIAENEIDDFSFWDDCGREAKKNPAPGHSHGNSGGASGGGAGVPKRKGDREEVRVQSTIEAQRRVRE